MAAFSKGDRVFAVKDLGDGWFTKVHKGTEGTVIAVEEPWFGSDRFIVKFDNDEILEELTENELYPCQPDNRNS